jgi:hypothetical protein
MAFVCLDGCRALCFARADSFAFAFVATARGFAFAFAATAGNFAFAATAGNFAFAFAETAGGFAFATAFVAPGLAMDARAAAGRLNQHTIAGELGPNAKQLMHACTTSRICVVLDLANE